MKLNFINKAYVLLAVIWLVAIAMKTINYKSWDRYYYFSSASTPSHYPIAVHNLYFILEDDDDAYFNTEDIRQFKSVWGEDYYFAEVHETQRLPKQLVVQYLSYREKRFYSDTVALPTTQIKTYFKEAAKKGQLEKMYHSSSDQMGLKFHVGLANNGQMVLWLRGAGTEKILLKTQLHWHEPSKEETHYAKPLSKDEYFKKVFETLPDSLKLEIDNGIDAKANYIDSPSRYLQKNK